VDSDPISLLFSISSMLPVHGKTSQVGDHCKLHHTADELEGANKFCIGRNHDLSAILVDHHFAILHAP